MPCVHLKQVYKLCQEHEIRLSSSDMISMFCKQCGQQEVCPDLLLEHGESPGNAQEEVAPSSEQSPTIKQDPQ